jgi:quercetin dioxygenase-like cupin family protein
LQAISVSEPHGQAVVDDISLPFPAATARLGSQIPATAFWLTRTTRNRALDASRLGPLLQVVLSGRMEIVPPGGESRTVGRGDVVYVDVQEPTAYEELADGDVWRLLVATPEWLPESGTVPAADEPEPRRGRPLMNWMYDDGGRSRTEPFRWPGPLYPVPDVDLWPKSGGAFLNRHIYRGEQFAAGTDGWHRGPRRQLAVTLSGSGENETGDGTRTRPHAGDFVFVDDTSGEGHRSRGNGDRRILFVTVADGSLKLRREC